MPWNDNKGGGGGGWNPGGGGGGGPWGRGPSNGGGGGRGQGPNMRPPDLDEVFKRGRDWLKRMFPNQPPGGAAAAMIGGVMVMLWLWSGIYVIPQNEVGVILRFGAAVGELQPGLHFRLPQPIETVIRQDIRQQQTYVGFTEDPDTHSTANVPRESLMLTKDENIVDTDFVVQWRVRSATQFSLNVAEAVENVKAVAESAMREAAGQSAYATMLAPGRAEIEARVQQIMQATLDHYKAGVWVERVNIRAANPPPQVIDAYNDVNTALQDKIRLRNEATKYANSVVPKAKGEAIKIVQDAEAYKQQQITEASGEAQRFISIYEQYKNAKTVTRERMFLETMQRVLGSTNKIILQTEGNSNLMPYLPLPELRRTQPAPVPATTTSGGR
jgi:membrane protease subunit HflK